MPCDGVDEILISAALYIAATIGLNGSADDEEFNTLDELGHSPGIVSATTEVTDLDPRHELSRQTAEEPEIVLKRDTFGTIRFDIGNRRIVRTMADAAPFARGIARRLARREAAALRQLDGKLSCPALIETTDEQLTRSFLPGQPLYCAQFDSGEFFRDALRQLRVMHACGVAHNDLAKEANWICMPGNRAGIVDFQIATVSRKRGRLFRTLAWEDLRHLLKHKAHYAEQSLTQRQRSILARPLWPARMWRRYFKPVYNFVTRRILGWPERNSALERTNQRTHPSR